MYLKYKDLSDYEKGFNLVLDKLGLKPVSLSNNYSLEYDILCCGCSDKLYNIITFEKNILLSIESEIKKIKPKAFILESSHWLYKSKEELEKLGYTIYVVRLNEKNFNCFMCKPHIFIIGFNKTQVDTTQPFECTEANLLRVTTSSMYHNQCNILFSEKGSICLHVIESIILKVKEYLIKNKINYKLIKKDINLNKGEWSEFFAFLKMIAYPNICFGDENLKILENYDHVTVYGLQHIKSEKSYILDNGLLKIFDGVNTIVLGNIEDIISSDLIDNIKKNIIESSKTFDINQQKLLDLLDIKSFKSDSKTKADINVSHNYQGENKPFDPWSIKSFLGGYPTLLNAGSTTNFIYEITNFNGDMNGINSIATRSKIKDRLQAIYTSGAKLEFSHCENQTFYDNLRKTDSLMPEYLSDILIDYYSGKGRNLTDLIQDNLIRIRVTDFLKAILLGMFSSKPWDGKYNCNGLLVIKSQGDLLLYHVIKDHILKDYLFNNTQLDTASSTRHRFGSIYQERNGKYYFKLNLQIRNK